MASSHSGVTDNNITHLQILHAALTLAKHGVLQCNWHRVASKTVPEETYPFLMDLKSKPQEAVDT